MSRARIALGSAGEHAACAYLEARGYRILARNIRAGGVEIDIVAQRAGIVAIVEVKTRSSDRFGSAAEAVDARKQARLIRGGAAWLREHAPRARRLRFDLITCHPTSKTDFQIEHWKNAFEASD